MGKEHPSPSEPRSGGVPLRGCEYEVHERSEADAVRREGAEPPTGSEQGERRAGYLFANEGNSETINLKLTD